MHDLLSITIGKVQDVVQQRGSIPLSHLESIVNVSYNLLFLAIDRLSAERKIQIKRKDTDYIILSPEDETEEEIKGGDAERSEKVHEKREDINCR